MSDAREVKDLYLANQRAIILGLLKSDRYVVPVMRPFSVVFDEVMKPSELPVVSFRLERRRVREDEGNDLFVIVARDEVDADRVVEVGKFKGSIFDRGPEKAGA